MQTIIAAQDRLPRRWCRQSITPPAKVSKDSVTMLKQDLEGENDAIARYSRRIRQAEELDLYHLAQQLRMILAMEQEHAMDLEQALGK